MRNIDEIAPVPGLSALMIGSGDGSMSLIGRLDNDAQACRTRSSMYSRRAGQLASSSVPQF
jgi:hypothetical protein